MKFVFALLLLLVSSTSWSSCWTGVVPGRYSKMLQCSYQDWKSNPQETSLQPFLQNLFYVYFTDGTDKTMIQFFDEMRKNAAHIADAVRFRDQLTTEYARFAIPSGELSEISALPQTVAAFLFILSQTDPNSLPLNLTKSVHLTVYRQLESLFALDLALRGQYGVLPASEYRRMLEIVNRMSWVPDPYLKAINHYFQGILLLHLHDGYHAVVHFEKANQKFQECLQTVQSQLSRKRILFRLADCELAQGKEDEAVGRFIAILKMDPRDWDALMSVSKILYDTGQCSDPGIWVEASITSKQKDYALTIHCGNIELPEEEFEDGAPKIALVAAEHFAIN